MNTNFEMCVKFWCLESVLGRRPYWILPWRRSVVSECFSSLIWSSLLLLLHHPPSPLRHGAPGSMLVGENVKDLLLELVGRHMVSVLGGADQVITHLLLFPPIRSILGAVGLHHRDRKKHADRLNHMQNKQIMHQMYSPQCAGWWLLAADTLGFSPQTQRACGHPQLSAGSGWTRPRWLHAQCDPSWHDTATWQGVTQPAKLE